MHDDMAVCEICGVDMDMQLCEGFICDDSVWRCERCEDAYDAEMRPARVQAELEAELAWEGPEDEDEDY